MEIHPLIDNFAVHFTTFTGDVYTLSTASITLTAGTLTAHNGIFSDDTGSEQLTLVFDASNKVHLRVTSGGDAVFTADGGTFNFDNENLITDGLINGVELGLTDVDNYFFGAITTLASLTTGERNIGIGTAAGTLISSGDDNTCIGSLAGEATTTNSDSVFIGTQAGRRADTTQLTMIGSFAGRFNTGGGNAFIGYAAGHGVDGLSTGGANTIIGVTAGFDLTTAASNVIIGNSAGANITSGGSNTLIGRNAGQVMTGSVWNVLIGQGTGKSVTSNRNTFIGTQAGENNTGGAGANVCIGFTSGENGDGSSNVFIGAFSGIDETGSDTFIVDNEDRTSEALGRTNALLYGLFENHASGPQLTINGDLSVGNSTTGRISKFGDGGTTDYIAISATGIITFNGAAAIHGQKLNIVTQTNTDYTLLDTDDTVLFSTSATTRTANLPAAATVSKKVYNIKKIDNGSGGIILDPNGSETIDGGLTATITVQFENLTIHSDGSNWHIL